MKGSASWEHAVQCCCKCVPPLHLFIAPSDYTGGRYRVTIPARAMEGRVSVFTNKSGALEDDEYFKATLHAPEHPRLFTGLTTAVITINDRTSGLIQKWLRMC